MIIATMRLRFLASERRRPDQFTVSLYKENMIIATMRLLLFPS